MDKKIIDFLQAKSINVIQEDVDTKLESWQQWYRGKADGFHQYKIYQGEGYITKERRTINMPRKICQDWADLLLNERVTISASDDNTQIAINRLLEQCKFYVKGNNLIESAFACGGGLLVQFYDGEKTNQKYILQKYMYPISFENGELYEVAIVSSKTIDKEKYTYLEVHTKDSNGNYVIDNFLLSKNGETYTEVSEDFYKKHKLASKIKTNRKEPCFQFIKPNLANPDNFDSPWGTSIFSGMVDAFKNCDIWFTLFYSEGELGRKRIFAKDGVTYTHIDQNGNQIKAFDPNDDVFYLLPGDIDNEDGKLPILEVNSELRVAQINEAIQTNLNIISSLAGLGKDYYKWDNGSLTTAKEVISTNSKMFRTLQKHELLLRDAIINMTKSLLYFEKEFGKDTKIDLNATITVDFDDSIIEDTAEKKRQALTDYNARIISAQEYFRQIYNLDDEQAENFAKKMAEERLEEAEWSQIDDEPFGA